MVPASLDLSAPVAAPPFGSHGVDYYKCYRAKISRTKPRYLPTSAQIHFLDLFEDRDYLLRPPTRVCTPASLDGDPVKTPGRHVLCCKASRGRYEAAHVPQTGAHTGDAIGATEFSTRREEELCVPAVVVPD